MKKTTILIDGQPFTYNDEIEDITYETISPISINDANVLLGKTKELFLDCGIEFSLIFGTLLGAIREHSIIEGDEDIDVFVDDEELLIKALPYLQEHGLCVCRIYEHILYSFRFNKSKAFIDVYIKRPISGLWGIRYCMLSIISIPKRYIDTGEYTEFLDGSYRVPKSYKKFFVFNYGKTWMTPIKGDHSHHHQTYYDIWHGIIGPVSAKKIYRFCKEITKKLLKGEKLY